jgi:hypothetical protein
MLHTLLCWDDNTTGMIIFGLVIIHSITVLVRSNFTVQNRNMTQKTRVTISGNLGSCYYRMEGEPKRHCMRRTETMVEFAVEVMIVFVVV